MNFWKRTAQVGAAVLLAGWLGGQTASVPVFSQNTDLASEPSLPAEEETEASSADTAAQTHASDAEKSLLSDSGVKATEPGTQTSSSAIPESGRAKSSSDSKLNMETETETEGSSESESESSSDSSELSTELSSEPEQTETSESEKISEESESEIISEKSTEKTTEESAETSTEKTTEESSDQTPETNPSDLPASSDPSFAALKSQLTEMTSSYEGTWSVYVKDLKRDLSLSINNRPSDSASLIKLYICGAILDAIQNGTLEETEEIDELLTEMITVSDNEAANELVRCLSDTHDHQDGLIAVNAFIRNNHFTDTIQYNGLEDPSLWYSDNANITSVEDCGRFLEEVYEGDLISHLTSRQIEGLLLDQTLTWKIPCGIPSEVPTANKTGEKDNTQNDVALVYTPLGDYILCIMATDLTEEDINIEHIRELSTAVYEYFMEAWAPAESAQPVSEQNTESSSESVSEPESELVSESESEPSSESSPETDSEEISETETPVLSSEPVSEETEVDVH